MYKCIFIKNQGFELKLNLSSLPQYALRLLYFKKKTMQGINHLNYQTAGMSSSTALLDILR